MCKAIVCISINKLKSKNNLLYTREFMEKVKRVSIKIM